MRTRYINAMLPEVNKALQRRAMLEPRYETEWGFRVKSKGEQAIANALRFYTITDPNTLECKRITLLYEPLFRIPDTNKRPPFAYKASTSGSGGSAFWGLVDSPIQRQISLTIT